jgi:beta-mannosidase
VEVLNLAGEWRLRGEYIDTPVERFFEVANKDGGEYRLYKEDKAKIKPSKEGYMKANVPCDVITPLVESGLLKEPLLKDNTKDVMWVGDMSWWFIREFDVTEEIINNEEVRLFIEMLDYNADIIINNIPIAKHKNTFRAFCFNVKKYLKVGKNQIIIRLTCGYEEHFPNDALTYYCNSKLGQRVYLRKPQFTHGWDWCKPVPTCGIGGKIFIEGITGARIDNFICETLEANEDFARLNLRFDIENLSMCTADDTLLHIEIKYDGNMVYKCEKDLYTAGGINHFEESVKVDFPKLWWPNGYGEQNLYEVSAYVECRNIKNHMKNKLIGIRTIQLDQSKYQDGTRRFDFVVNGVKVFCKGGNWVPADSVYLRVPDEKYEALVKEAAECNFTMLRVWGGGLYEPDCFYEYCSKYGILVMQDFMYACAFYPDYLNWFMHEAHLEADYQTKRLASFACLAVWTGNNEVHEAYTDWFRGPLASDTYYGTKIFNYLLPEVVKKNSPLIHYMPSSPFYGNKANDMFSGDCHMWAWTRKPNETGFDFMYELEAFDRQASKVRFSSEYGFYGTLKRSSIERFYDGEEIALCNDIWTHHGEQKGKRALILNALERHMVDTTNINEEEYLLYSGIMQGVLYDELTLALRRMPHCSGQLIWMYNDCWPETGWTVIDYYLTRKSSFYFMKRSCRTNISIVRAIDGNVSIVTLNESPVAEEMKAEYGYMDFYGNKSHTQQCVIKVGAHDRHCVNEFTVEGDLTKGFYYVLTDNDFSTSLRGYFRNFDFPEAKIEIVKKEVSQGKMNITLRSNAFAPVVNVKLDDDRVHLSDNYFQMLPNVDKEVTIDGYTGNITAEAVKFHKVK